MENYLVIAEENKVPIKAWVKGVQLEKEALEQLRNITSLRFIFRHIAVMPDVHMGIGATVGSVIPTYQAIIPAAVGVDIGCGMLAVKTSLVAENLPDNLRDLRMALEKAVPHGRSNFGGFYDKGAWGFAPKTIGNIWKDYLEEEFKTICDKHPIMTKTNNVNHLGTLGGGNHFIELCLDENKFVWIMLHSGSRGVGNKIGNYFIELAKKDMRKFFINLPDLNLAYFPEGTENFNDYVKAVGWAQRFASFNREIMLSNILAAISKFLPPFKMIDKAINCHHNYVEKENHFGKNIWVTRKGAVRARVGDLGIIPGSMGAKSYIVKGKGNPESFTSCSHGAGRVMSRTKAKSIFTVEDHVKATQGVECRKDKEVIDETPGAYKDIDAVMQAQNDLVEVVHTLKQFLCIKG